jgi:hypothetical protein
VVRPERDDGTASVVDRHGLDGSVIDHCDDATLTRLPHDLDVAGDWHGDT